MRYILLFFVFFPAIAGAFVGSYTDVTPSRSLSTNYQNTTTEDRFVYVTPMSVDDYGSGYIFTALIGPSTGTLSATAYSAHGNCGGGYEECRGQMSFVVPPGYYYRVNFDCESPCDGGISEWWEYETPEMSGGGGGGGSTYSQEMGILFAGFAVSLAFGFNFGRKALLV